MTTTFETAKVGDRVWSLTQGWGEIIGIVDDSAYPLSVKYDSTGCDTFTFSGYSLKAHAMRRLFWGEIVIEAPAKPMPDLPVDTNVLVWVRPDVKLKRHFYQFKDDQIVTFKGGKTSFTTSCEYDVTVWPNWELAE